MGYRILCVDDDQGIIDSVPTIFEYEDGFDVVDRAGTAARALALAEGQKYDLILLDLVLPGTTGMQLLTQLLPLCGTIVILSGADQHLYTRRALRAGAYGYICKNFDIDYLIQAVRAALAGQPLPEPPLQIRSDYQRRIVLHDSNSMRAAGIGALRRAGGF